MDAFVSRKRRRISPAAEVLCKSQVGTAVVREEEEESTDVKLAIISSLHPEKGRDDLLEILLSCDGNVQDVLKALENVKYVPRKRQASTVGLQSALAFERNGVISPSKEPAKSITPLTKKGKTLYLYTPEDVATHTPCSIIHNFLPKELANALLEELLPEVATFSKATFKLFDNVVQSPHTASFYVEDLGLRNAQNSSYLYNGSSLDDVREILPRMREVSTLVKEAVNTEIEKRIRMHYPGGKKLKFQSPQPWQPNAAFVNCYDGPQQHVGFHSDQLSYLGPRAIIGSLSLGVAREFRVRKIMAKDENDKGEAADASGQISIHLPHNSLLVMHAEMQEEWKHSIAPAQAIDPHPIAKNKRINITYRWYRESFSPKYTPKCKCKMPAVLKCVQRQKVNRGKYMWMCQAPGNPDGGPGCGYFEWAEFTDDGEPLWKNRRTDRVGEGSSHNEAPSL
jgi:hypothetical protein